MDDNNNVNAAILERLEKVVQSLQENSVKMGELLAVHNGAAISPPNDSVGAKQFYIHSFQDDYNRVVSGERVFELVNYNWKYPYHIVNLNVHNGALFIPRGTFHRSVSGENGSIVINQAKRYDGFDPSAEFYPVSCATNIDLYNALTREKPVIHKFGE